MEVFYGYDSEYGKKPVRRKRASPARKRRSPARKRRSPARKRRSPVRKCNSKMTLSNLRKLALENDVNIFSEAKTAISKRTGEPKKPKMVGCSTLMKRMNEAGLGYMYKVRQEYSQADQFDPAYAPGPFSSVDQNVPTFSPLASPLASPPAAPQAVPFVKQLQNPQLKKPPADPRPLVPPPLSTNIPGVPNHVIKGNCKDNKVNYTGNCVNAKDVPQKDCYGDVVAWDINATPPVCSRYDLSKPCAKGEVRYKNICTRPSLIPEKDCYGDLVVWDKNRDIPVCLSRDSLTWTQWAILNGQGLADGVKQWTSGTDAAGPAGFGARRRVSEARPKALDKRLKNVVTIRGRTHQVFKGIKGGLYYLKGKAGNKIYISPKRYRKH